MDDRRRGGGSASSISRTTAATKTTEKTATAKQAVVWEAMSTRWTLWNLRRVDASGDSRHGRLYRILHPLSSIPEKLDLWRMHRLEQSKQQHKYDSKYNTNGTVQYPIELEEHFHDRRRFIFPSHHSLGKCNFQQIVEFQYDSLSKRTRRMPLSYPD